MYDTCPRCLTRLEARIRREVKALALSWGWLPETTAGLLYWLGLPE